jgi:outer membrane protein assembly factor BamB
MRSFPLEEEASLVSADAQGNIFIATPDGEIKKYTAAGQLLNTFSPQSANHFTVLQARSTMQIMAFDENNQQLLFLDRFLNPVSSIELPFRELGYVSALTLAAGNTLWVADASAGKLRQWRFDTGQLLLSLNLNQLINAAALNIQALREYQHKLYLFSPGHVYVFDQLGNFEQEFAIPPIEAISFMGDQLIGLNDQKLVAINLYSGEEQHIALPGKKEYQQVLYSKGELYLFSRREADVYRPKP